MAVAMVWTADRDEHARELATQQQDFHENPFSDEQGLSLPCQVPALFGG